MRNLDDVAFQWLDGDDLRQLEPILEEKGWMSLSRVFSRALCAFDEEGKIIAFFVLQAIPHAEPLYVEPAWRGTGVAEALVDKMHQFFSSVKCRGVMLVADDPIVARMAEDHGMKKIESPVYVMVGGDEGV